MNEQKSKKTKLIKLSYIVVFLTGMLIGCPVVFLTQPHLYEKSAFFVNKERDTKAEKLTNKKWAGRLKLRGVQNLHKVSDDLYRGAQPTKEGILELKKLGIKTIVNLRSFHSEREHIKGTGLSYKRVPMKKMLRPNDGEVIRFLKIVSNKEHTPVFVHCHRGADRTGIMCAMYRVAMQNWDKSVAIAEMTKGGFGFSKRWHNLVEYVQKANIDKIKERAGLKK